MYREERKETEGKENVLQVAKKGNEEKRVDVEPTFYYYKR